MMTLNTTIATRATTAQRISVRASEPNEELLPMAGNLLPVSQDDLIVSALEVRETLGPGHLAILEAQAGEPVATHRRVVAAGGGNEGEPAHGQAGRDAGCGHGIHSAPWTGGSPWPVR